MTVSINGTNGLTFSDSSVQSTAATGFGFKNRIINGAMMIDQRNAGASVTPGSGSSQYLLDRWMLEYSQTSKLTIQQNAGSVTPPDGFSKYIGITVGASANVTVGSSDYFNFQQKIEGYNFADFGFGTSSASPLTLSFWIRSSVTGTFGGSLRSIGSGASQRSYPFVYTINAANTWEYKTVSVVGETTGSAWDKTNNIGISVIFGLGMGATYSGTAGSWASANYASATGAVKLVETNSATWYITGVQLEKGSTATSFDYRPYGTELALCQRYYYQITGNLASIGAGYARTTTVFAMGNLSFPVQMRASPTLTATNATGAFGVSIGGSDFSGPTVSLQSQVSPTGAGLNLTVASGTMTVGQGGQLYTQGASTFVGFSSEL